MKNIRNRSTVSYQLGEIIRLRGATRQYTGEVTESEPNKITVKIGDSWFNTFEYIDGEWIGRPRTHNREAPKMRLIGTVKH